MSDFIRIGTGFYPGETPEIQKSLLEKWEFYRQLTDETLPELTFSAIQPHSWFDDISENKIDIACIDLQEAPFALSDSCLYFAMKSGKTAGKTIFCHPDYFSPSDDLKLKKNTVITVRDESEGIMLQYLNPDILYRISENGILPEPYHWQPDGLQAVLWDTFIDEKSIPEGFVAIHIHPDEFPEKAGNGRLVFGGHRDSAGIMKAFHACFHERELVPCANTEREIARHFVHHTGISLRVRCRKDDRNNYHVRAVVIHEASKKIFQHTMSQSTHFKLAEKMIDVLNQNL